MLPQGHGHWPRALLGLGSGTGGRWVGDVYSCRIKLGPCAAHLPEQPALSGPVARKGAGGCRSLGHIHSTRLCHAPESVRSPVPCPPQQTEASRDGPAGPRDLAPPSATFTVPGRHGVSVASCFNCNLPAKMLSGNISQRLPFKLCLRTDPTERYSI